MQSKWIPAFAGMTNHCPFMPAKAGIDPDVPNHGG